MNTLSHFVSDLFIDYDGQIIWYAHKQERNKVEKEERENVWLHQLSFIRLARLGVVCCSWMYWGRGEVVRPQVGFGRTGLL